MPGFPSKCLALREWKPHPSSSDSVGRPWPLSIYFREPGGVLFEIANDGPGFATDEDPAHLGECLALPPFLEPYRASIEEGLVPIDVPSLPVSVQAT